MIFACLFILAIAYKVTGIAFLTLLLAGVAWSIVFLVISIYLVFATYESEVARIGMTVLLFVPVTSAFVPYITYFVAVSLIKKHKR